MNEQELIKKWEEGHELKLFWEEIFGNSYTTLLFSGGSVVVRPLSPPSGIIHYIDLKV